MQLQSVHSLPLYPYMQIPPEAEAFIKPCIFFGDIKPADISDFTINYDDFSVVAAVQAGIDHR